MKQKCHKYIDNSDIPFSTVQRLRTGKLRNRVIIYSPKTVKDNRLSDKLVKAKIEELCRLEIKLLSATIHVKDSDVRV